MVLVMQVDVSGASVLHNKPGRDSLGQLYPAVIALGAPPVLPESGVAVTHNTERWF